MPDFKFKRKFSGHIRGTDIVTVTAASLEEAESIVQDMEEDERTIVRDDTSTDGWELV